MKNFILVVAAIASLNSFASDLDCAKDGSKITMDNKTVTIDSSNVALTGDILAMAERSFGSAEGVTVGISISFPKKDLKCSTGMPKVFNCSGKTKKASVTLNISQRSMMGSSSSQLMRRPIKIENIDISSSVGAQGPIVLGSGPTTVNLDQVLVKSSMFVKMNGDFQLEVDQAFKNSSECK